GRLGLLEEMEQAFYRDYKAGVGTDHKTTYQRAVTLMQSREAKAFDLSLEPEQSKAAYGNSKFGEGCLLARRLMETGVPFGEGNLGGGAPHQDNSDRVKRPSQQVDPASSALVHDLKQRGLLDSTLVVWMGEFGRTPKINTRGAKPGRDHYPRAWSLVMAGGGPKTGQGTGKNDGQGGRGAPRAGGGVGLLSTPCPARGDHHPPRNQHPHA